MKTEGQDEAVGLAALDLVPEAVVVVGPGRVVEHCNRRTAALLGTDELVGRPLHEAIDLRDESGSPCPPELLELPAAADRLAERLLTVELPDGRTRPVTVTGRRLADGRMLLTFRNAARRMRLDAASSDLIATVSHEIRSPLTSVKGFTRTMLAKWERFSDEQKRTMLETINEDADRVTRLLTELLDVSRIDAGRVQLHPEPIEVVEIVERVVKKAELRPEAKGRRIHLELDGRGHKVNADPDKVEQIVTNLVENALTHAPGSEIEVTGEVTEAGLELAVSDDGPGIPSEMQRHIFEKFGRSSRRSGTGLGLYITRGLVRAHGGRVWCDSDPGRGTTFHVHLPVEGPHRR